MLKARTIQTGKLLKQALTSLVLVSVVALAYASKGGGGEKKKNATPVKTDFTPIRTSSGFTLKSGPAYSGSYFIGQEKKANNVVTFNTLVTYQKGNTIFILPSNYKVNIGYPAGQLPKSSLQLIDLKIKMGK